jgi:hypothetical protein
MVSFSDVDLAHPSGDIWYGDPDTFAAVNVNWERVAVREIVLIVICLGTYTVARVRCRTWSQRSRWLGRNFPALLLLVYLSGSAFLIAWVPCTSVIEKPRFGTPSLGTNYFWLWDVGYATVSVTTIVLEEMAFFDLYGRRFCFLSDHRPSKRAR